MIVQEINKNIYAPPPHLSHPRRPPPHTANRHNHNYPFRDSHRPPSPTPTGFYLYPRSSISKTRMRLANSVGIINARYRDELIAAVHTYAATTPRQSILQSPDPDPDPKRAQTGNVFPGPKKHRRRTFTDGFRHNVRSSTIRPTRPMR